jgi:hypothetical protein
MIAKDETKAPAAKKHLFTATARSASGPFTVAAPKITGSYWAEGPTAVQVGNTTRVYFDRYMEGRWGAVESADLTHWIDVSDRISFPKGARHGSVVAVDKASVPRMR